MEVDADEKSREAIKAEREAKKLAKAAAKQGNKAKVEPSTQAESVKVENTESEKPDQVKIRHETFYKSKVMYLSLRKTACVFKSLGTILNDFVIFRMAASRRLS